MKHRRRPDEGKTYAVHYDRLRQSSKERFGRFFEKLNEGEARDAVNVIEEEKKDGDHSDNVDILQREDPDTGEGTEEAQP